MPANAFDEALLSSNIAGAKTLSELFEKEKIITNAKLIHLEIRPVPGVLDYTHLKAIHRYLFEDIYTWAGQDRFEAGITAKFGKGTTLFTPYDRLPSVALALFDALRDENRFEGQTPDEFVESAAIFLNGLNILHPFREGNGRTQRIFMEYLAGNAGYGLDFSRIEADEMILACIAGVSGDLSRMKQMMKKAFNYEE